jgi:hypothetical protein
MKPIDIACSHQNDDLTNCGAGAGEPCRFDRVAPPGVLFHAERIQQAASIGPSGDELARADDAQQAQAELEAVRKVVDDLA